MTILALTDIHGAASHILQIEKELRSVDLVLLGGDITHFGGITAASTVLDAVKQINSNIFGVAGNCDEPEIDEFLSIENLGGHGSIMNCGEYTIAGAGGSLPAPVFTPHTFSEAEYGEFFARLEGELLRKPDIIVSHQPPWNTRLDKVWGGKHVGCRSLRKYIENNTPRLVFSGHIHESSGVDRIGDTRLVNPGPFRHGCFAHILIDDSTVEIDLKQS